MLLTKLQNPCAKPSGIYKEMFSFADNFTAKNSPKVLDWGLQSKQTSKILPDKTVINLPWGFFSCKWRPLSIFFFDKE